MAEIKRALLSVSDKQGIVEFGRSLQARGVEILSTGGTAALLRDAGMNVMDVSSYTGFPEMMDGRIKTLHPKVHGALLGRRSVAAHVAAMQQHGITPIDLVAVNLYPFEQAISRADCSLAEAIENIDIGGPTMLRSAAKNFVDVTVVVDPADYGDVLDEIATTSGSVSLATNFALARKVFARTAAYDRAITDYLAGRSAEELS